MTFNVFQKEQQVISTAKALIDSGQISPRDYEALLTAYEKLFKSVRRLITLSDRNEAELNKTAKALGDKNAMLESLSDKLGKYLSPQIYASIFSGRQGTELKTKRKKLTVFFSDIKDFTSITADLQPEDLTYLLNTYFSEMSQIALKHEATIDKFIGDAMLVFTGDPESKGVVEDARACVRMALEMQQRMRDLAEMWKAKGYNLPFEMRIGLNTGYCNVGNFGSEQQMDYTIIGGEVNLAARLESNAPPGGVLMSYETYSLVKDMVEVEERDPFTMKGIKRQVRAFEVTNVLADYEETRRVLHHQDEGIYLHLNVDRLQGEARTQAAQQLEAALVRLRTSED